MIIMKLLIMIITIMIIVMIMMLKIASHKASIGKGELFPIPAQVHKGVLGTFFWWR